VEESMGTLLAIKEYSQLAAVITRSTVWALGVLGHNALRGFGRFVRNVLPGGKEPQAVETSKQEWVIGYEPSGMGWVTIGFIATRWDDAPKVGLATTYFTMEASRVQAMGRERPSDGQLAFLLEQGLRANIQVDDLGQFSLSLGTFLGRDETFFKGLAKGKFGFLITFKFKEGKYRLRVSHIGPESAVLRTMNEIDNIRRDYGHAHIPEQLMYAFDFRPEDERITGKLGVKDGVASLEGWPITLAMDGWLGTSAVAPLPGRFPAPKRQVVRRYPASSLD
jgi:hypothetical protein